MFERVVFGLTGAETEQELEKIPGMKRLLTELKEHMIRTELAGGMEQEKLSECLVITDRKELAQSAAAGSVCIGYAPAGSRISQPWAELVLEGFEEADVWLLEQSWCHGRGEPFRVAEGKRIYLQELTAESVAELYRIYHQPEVMVYIHEMPEDLEAEKTKLEAYQSAYRFYGCGIWGIYQKADDRLIGTCGLELKDWGQYQEVSAKEEETHLELGYVLDPEFWGQGYATEAAGLALECAGRLGYETVWARISRCNLPSQAVAERIGMKREAYDAEKYQTKTAAAEASEGIQQTYVYRRAVPAFKAGASVTGKVYGIS